MGLLLNPYNKKHFKLPANQKNLFTVYSSIFKRSVLVLDKQKLAKNNSSESELVNVNFLVKDHVYYLPDKPWVNLLVRVPLGMPLVFF